MANSAIFKWETVREVESHVLVRSGNAIPGRICEIELTCGKTIRVWRSDDGREYFCHGLTFGGKEAPNASISPFSGQSVEMILSEYYDMIPEGEATSGDIVVWRGIAPVTTPHSAIVKEALKSGSRLDYSAKVQSKNGLLPERIFLLGELVEIYGQSYGAYRRKM